MADDPTPPDLQGILIDDRILGLLASETRRATLQVLRSDHCRSLDDLAHAVADSDLAPMDRPKRVSQRLHHCHLPKLDSAGVLRYDPDEQRVDYLGDETVERALAALEE